MEPRIGLTEITHLWITNRWIVDDEGAWMRKDDPIPLSATFEFPTLSFAYARHWLLLKVPDRFRLHIYNVLDLWFRIFLPSSYQLRACARMFNLKFLKNVNGMDYYTCPMYTCTHTWNTCHLPFRLKLNETFFGTFHIRLQHNHVGQNRHE